MQNVEVPAAGIAVRHSIPNASADTASVVWTDLQIRITLHLGRTAPESRPRKRASFNDRRLQIANHFASPDVCGEVK